MEAKKIANNFPEKPAGALRLVGIKVAAKYAHMSASRLYDLIATEKIEARKDGRTTLVDLNSIDAYQRALPRVVLRRRVP